MGTVLDTIGEKLAQGRSLGRDDAIALWDTQDLIRLGMLADDVRRRRHGATTTFVRVADVLAREIAQVVVPPAAGEVRLIATASELDASMEHVRVLTTRHSGLPVTAGQLEQLVDEAGPALPRLLVALREAGVCAVASAAVDRLADPVAAVQTVLDAGLRVARFVVARAGASGPWDVLNRVDAVQRATGSVRAFAPLAREEDQTQPTTGYSDVKVVALSRLLLDQVPSIQVDWTRHGPKLAQVALLFGADDLDAVSPAEEGDSGRRRAPLEELLRNVRAASLSPRERDGRFETRAEGR